jgi:hypothetical protein
MLFNCTCHTVWNGRMMANRELETTLKEVVVAYFKVLSQQFDETLRKVMKSLRQGSRSPSTDSDVGPPKYEVLNGGFRIPWFTS